MKLRSVRIICILLALFSLLGCISVCAEEERTTGIVSARYTEDGSKLIVKATLSDGMLELCRGRYIFLLEFFPCDKNADVAKKDSVGFKLAASEMTFELDMTEADPQRKYSKYILAYREGADYKLIGNVVYAENPEALAAEKAENVACDGIVGIAAGESGDADGFDHAVVPVYVNEMFADTADGSIRYVYGEDVYYIDTEMLSHLDRQVSELSGGGAGVYLQLLLSAPDETMAELAHELYSAEEGGLYYAPNTDNPRGVRLWSSLLEFLCRRYCVEDDNGAVSAFIYGDNVNVKKNHAGIGTESIDAFTQELLRSVRITETALRTTCRDVGLYVSLSGDMNDSAAVYPVGRLLSDICVPELSFGVYMDVSTSSAEFWTEEVGNAITPKNMESLIDFLRGGDYLCNGEIRPLMLGYSTEGSNRELQAASALAYVWRAMSMPEILAVIYNKNNDADGGAEGLFDPDGGAKAVYNELLVAAEGDPQVIGDRIRECLGESRYESLRDSVLSDLFVQHEVLPPYTAKLPGDTNAVYLADFVDGNMYGFLTDTATATFGFTADSTGNVLRLTGKKGTAGMSRTYDGGYDISEKGILIIELKPLTEDPSATLTVVLKGRRGSEPVSLKAKTELTSGEWEQAAFNISGLDYLDEMVISVASGAGADLTFYVKDITVCPTGDSAYETAVKIAIGVLVGALVFMVILLISLIYMRSRRRRVKRSSYRVSRRASAKRTEASVAEKPEAAPVKSEPEIPVMPKTEPKTFVVPSKPAETVSEGDENNREKAGE